jgi:hypothetical protein
MTSRRKPKPAPLWAIFVATILLLISCRNHPKPQKADETFLPASEPEIYTAMIVRSIEEDGRTEILETRVMRSGLLRREEWMEKGESLALITRFDSGKSYLLNLDKQTYVETDLALNAAKKTQADTSTKNVKGLQATAPAEAQNADANRQTTAMDFVEDDFADEPKSFEQRPMADESVGNQLCKVIEKRASFADGRSEITKIYRAENLLGLTVKTELETISPTQRVKIITEWRDIKLEAQADAFVLPGNFKKVQSLSSR